jgi:hypothetical protein
MEIRLIENDSAAESREGQTLTGSRKDEDESAVITWSTQCPPWLGMDGEKYSKTPFKDGAMDGDAVSAERRKKARLARFRFDDHARHGAAEGRPDIIAHSLGLAATVRR